MSAHQTRRPRWLGLAATTLALSLPPAPALAEPILAPDDASELAESLAEATQQQGICYGWHVRVRDEQTGDSQLETGSGSEEGVRQPSPGGPVTIPLCPTYMVLVGGVTYTATTSESEDSAALRIESNLLPAPMHDLRELGVSDRDLLGNNDDIALFKAVSTLPLLAAQLGLAPYLSLEPNSVPIPSEDQLTGKPGSDFTRTYWPLLTLAGLVLVVGLVGIVLTLTGVLPP